SGANLRQLLGYTSDDFAASLSLWMDRIHPDDRQRVVDRFGLLGGRPGCLGEGAHALEEWFVGEHGPRPSDTPGHAVHVDVQQVVRWPVPSCL
ncbi:PAS domain-containing protein, partial [Acinetobacter baumannii]|nr:PAS domain-containing protein [Acinetobacter baumannii]